MSVTIVVRAQPDGKLNSRNSSAEHESPLLVGPISTKDFAVEPYGLDWPTGDDPRNRLIVPFMKHLGQDQATFWTAPGRLRIHDLRWIAPLAGVTAAFVSSDSWMSNQVPLGHVQSSKTFSNYAAYSMVGLAGGSFLLGKIRGNDHLTETGLLSSEAALNSAATTFLFKMAFQRQRPLEGTQHGAFFRGGNSFPSEHAALAWSVASVWAHEYSSPLSKTLAYGLASAVTLTRVTGKQHFPSDVIVGSALGWYFGRQIYRAHHDVDLGGDAWGDPFDEETPRESRPAVSLGSPYVALDSWVYPAFDQLIALGFVPSAHLGIRPWTRTECARLVEEAEELGANDSGNVEAEKTLSALVIEFAGESSRLDGDHTSSARFDSIYARTTAISGTPLRDGFHFGQSIINDYGRPYASGFNAIAGFVAHAETGPIFVSLQGEFQRSAAIASDPQQVLDATAAIDGTRAVPNAVPEISRFRLIEGAVGMTFRGVQLSFGQQSLWLGPGHSGPFLFSNNSAPMMMFRIDSVSPREVPLFSRVLGPMRSEFFLGRLSGQQWEFSPELFGPRLASQPWVHGSKVSFHPTPNLEFGLGFTAQFGGTGNPFTWGNFSRTFYAHRVGVGRNPAKRLAEFEFSYRVPGIRDWMQVYADSMVIDEYSPLGSTRPAINPGVYFPKLPKLHQVDLRLEGITTDLNVPDHFGAGAFYWDVRYRSGYTNDGNLIGSWIGRRGRGQQGWLTYRFSPRNSIQFGYRHNNVDPGFLGGGNLRDLTLRADWMLRHDISVTALVQQENWHFPVLSPAARSNVLASFQIAFLPKGKTDAGN